MRVKVSDSLLSGVLLRASLSSQVAVAAVGLEVGAEPAPFRHAPEQQKSADFSTVKAKFILSVAEAVMIRSVPLPPTAWAMVSLAES